MHTFKVKRDSWHYRFLTSDFGGDYHRLDIEEWNFCKYWRVLVLQVLWVLIWIFGALILAAGMGTSFLIETIGMERTVWLPFLGLVVGLFFEKRDARKRKSRNEVYEPGLLMVKYRSWKEKFCPDIEVE